MFPASLCSFKCTTISGNRNVIVNPNNIPESLAPQSCGNTERFYGLAAGETHPDLTPSLSVVNDISFLMQKLKKEGLETAEVTVNTATRFPLNNNRPLFPPVIYERDSFKNKEPWQEARIRMLEIAYQTKNIFSISFQPKDPSIHQTWYLRAGCAQDPWIERGYKEGWISEPTTIKKEDNNNKNSNKPKDMSAPMQPLTGMLKPYPTFSSSLCDPDLNLENDTSDALTVSIEDIILLPIGQLQPGELKDSLSQITQLFMKDNEASRMAIVYLQPSDTLNPVKRLLISKV